MTDKIIIDGVDVSECVYLKYDKIGCDIDNCYCRGADCYYKQLAGAKEEIEKLKAQLQTLDDKTVGVTIPKSLLKDKSKQEIIEFAKTCPEFKDLQDKEYHLMSEKELETAFNTTELSLASFDKEKETEEKPEEDKE